MYSAYKLNKQADNIQPWSTPFPIWNQSVIPCPVLLPLDLIQISREAGQVVWYSHLLKNFPVYCDPHSQRLWHSRYSRNRCFSGTLFVFRWSSRCWQFDFWFLCLSKTSVNIWKFTVPILLKPGLENFEHYFTSMWDECNCAVVWAFFGIAFLWHCLSLALEWKLTFSSPVATAEFSKFAGILSAALSQLIF